MPYINLPFDLQRFFQTLSDRVTRLEMGQRFTLPNVATDPTTPRNGDMWLNTTTNQMKVVDSTGTVRVVTWV